MWAARANQFIITPLLLFRKRIKESTGEGYISLSLAFILCFVLCLEAAAFPSVLLSPSSHDFLLSSFFPCSSLHTHPPPTPPHYFFYFALAGSFIDICFPLIYTLHFSTWRPCETWCTKNQLESCGY